MLKSLLITTFVVIFYNAYVEETFALVCLNGLCNESYCEPLNCGPDQIEGRRDCDCCNNTCVTLLRT